MLVALVIAGGVFALSRRGSHSATERVSAFGPTGDATDPLAALTVEFTGKVDRKRIESGLVIAPAAKGTVAWNGNSLQFKPSWPGLAPGAQYQVEIKDGKSRLMHWTFKTSGDLGVQFTNPAPNDVEVDLQALVIVQFNRPVAALTALGQQRSGPVVVFDPPVQGSGSWLTSSTYRFRPVSGFAPSTPYSVRVPHDLTQLPGGALPADYSFSFTTALPAVADQFPRDNTQFVDPAADIRVLFNQPMDAASAQSSFSLLRAGVSVPGSYAWPDAQTMVFHPGTSLPRGASLTATVSTGAKSRDGKGASAKPFSWGFTTAPSPSVDKTDPANGSSAGSTFGITISFNTPMDHDSTEAAFSLRPAPSGDNKPLFFWGPDTQLRVNVPLDPSQAYTATVGARAKDRYGQSLGGDFTLAFTTAARPPSLTIVSGSFGAGQGTLDANSPPVVYVATTNVQQSAIQLSSLTAGEFRSLSNSSQQRQNFVPSSASVLGAWTLPFPDQKLNETLVTPVDLSQHARSGSLPPGYYLFDAGGGGQRQRITLEVTRTNLVVKHGKEIAFVWASDLATGAPVAGASVTVMDVDGNQIGGGTTEADGTFSTSIPVPAPNRAGNPIFVQVQRSGDAAMGSDGWTGTVPPYSFGFPVNLSGGNDLRGYVYFDRPIYRTGETVHIRAIVRADDDGRYSVPQSTPGIMLEVTDSRGNSLASYPAAFDEFGSMSVDFSVPADGATGSYSAALKSGSQFIASGGLLVAEFRAPEFQVALTTNSDSYVNGDTLKAAVQADLFFGSPLSGAEVKWQVNASPYAFRPTDPALSGFSFNDPDVLGAQRPAPGPVANSTGTLDAGGHFSFTVPARVAAGAGSSTFTASATVTDSNQQQVSASASAIVHGAAIYAGVRPRQYLSTSGQPSVFDLVTVDTAGRPAPSATLDVEAFQRTWTTVKKRDADGSEQYVSTPADTSVDRRSVSTDGQGKGSYTFTPSKGGQYRIVVSGRDAAGNAFRSATFVYVTSSELLSWRVNNNDRIDLVADRDSYAPGDVAHILVPAPFEGAVGLVSIERARIMSHRVQQFSSNSTVVDVPITEAMAPTVYVSVALLHPSGDAGGVAAYRLGNVQLKVSPESHRLQIALTPDATRLGPHDTVNVTVQTSDQSGRGVPAEVSLAVVDQAVLSLADERTGSLFDAYYGSRPLGIGTGSSVGVSLNVANQAFATENSGGKGGGGSGNDASSLDLRRTFQNTAFWQPAVKTDATGRAVVAVKLPDNLTTWRINARGLTASTTAGEGGTSIVTSQDLIVRPVVPRFFTGGDAARLGAIVNNQTDAAMSVSVSLGAEGIEVKGGAQTVQVPAKGAASVYWETVAGDGPTATLTWQAKGATGQPDAVQLKLPIQDRTTPETVASAGVVTSVPADEKLVVPDYARPNKGGISFDLSPSLAGVLKAASAYLESRPYEPVDVTAARLLDRVAVWQTDVKLQAPAAEQSDAKAAADKAIARLVGRQGGDGGYGWWEGSTSSPAITSTVLFSLGTARRAGLSVDASVITRAAKYLTDYYGRPTDALHPADPTGRAQILLALAVSGSGTADRDRALESSRATLDSSARGALLQALLFDGVSKDDPDVRSLASDLASSAIASATGSHWEDAQPSGGTAAAAAQATALVVPGLLKLDPLEPALEGAMRWLSAARRDGHWSTPYETALSINAIGAYVVARETVSTGTGYTISVNGKQVGAGDFQQATATGDVRLQVPLDGLPTNAPVPVDISRQGVGQLYYGLVMNYFTPSDTVAALSRGVSVAREYLPASDETPMTQFKAGDVVRVKLTVIAPAELQQVVLEDFLPAGLEAVDNSLKTTDPNLVRQQAAAQQQALQQGAAANQPGLTLITDRQRRLFNPFVHREVLDNRVALFAPNLSRGVHEYVYFARATTSGTFTALPATVTESDYPDVFGRTDSVTITFTP